MAETRIPTSGPCRTSAANGLTASFSQAGSIFIVPGGLPKQCGLKWIGKPDSVVTHNRITAIIRLAPRLLKGSSDHTRGLWADRPTLLFGLAPGGVCHAFTITGEPVSSYLAFSTLPGAKAPGGMFSVVLSPDHSGPPLTATLSCGVRTFLPPR